MAIVPAKTYQVLRAAVAPEEDTTAVAEELAAYENRLGGIKESLWAVSRILNAAATIAILGVLARGHGPLP